MMAVFSCFYLTSFLIELTNMHFLGLVQVCKLSMAVCHSEKFALDFMRKFSPYFGPMV